MMLLQRFFLVASALALALSIAEGRTSDSSLRRRLSPGRKDALIISILYPDVALRCHKKDSGASQPGVECKFVHPNKLDGTYRDGLDMKEFLKKKCHFDSVIHMTDVGTSKTMYPNLANVTRELKRLVGDAKEGDIIWFYFSGHGLDAAASPYELDGKSEALALSGGDILTDVWLTENFANQIPSGVRALAMIDACRSGTMIDLPYMYNEISGFEEVYGWDRNGGEVCPAHLARPSEANNDVGKLVYLSGCRADQNSMDWGWEYGGAMTACFLETCNKQADCSYDTLINAICTEFEGVCKNIGLCLQDGEAQEPQLSANYQVPAGEKLFSS